MRIISVSFVVFAVSMLTTQSAFSGRYYDAKTGRFLTVDPHGDKYRAFSPYNYALNNPLKYIDPDGKDAIPVVYANYKVRVAGVRVPFLGHAGVLLIDNKTGFTKDYEYGRYDSEGKGIIRTFKVPNVVLDKETGMPTQGSLNKIMGVISEVSGQSGDITGAYIQNDSFKEMNDYAKGKLDENKSEDRKEYDLLDNNCATFVGDILEAGGVSTTKRSRPVDYIKGVRTIYDLLDYDSSKKQTAIEKKNENRNQ